MRVRLHARLGTPSCASSNQARMLGGGDMAALNFAANLPEPKTCDGDPIE